LPPEEDTVLEEFEIHVAIIIIIACLALIKHISLIHFS